MNRAFLAAMAVAATQATAPAQATTYTYDFTFAYPLLREALLGAFADPRPGRGSVSGRVTFGADFFTTGDLLYWDITSSNTATGFTAQNSYTYQSSDTTETQSYTAASIFSPSFALTFFNPEASVGCDVGLVAPSGQHRGRRYSISGSTLRLDVDRNFAVGDPTLALRAYDIFGTAPLCESRGFADLGYEHTYFQNTPFVMGSLDPSFVPPGTGGGTGGSGGTGGGAGGTGGSGGTGGNGDTPPPSPVPLPAGLVLLLSGLAGLVALRRRA